MKEPSSTQLKAIDHLSGPAQIIAGPGSGKTFTIIQRLIHLIYDYKISPDNILVITYTKAAAKEMEHRYQLANTPRNISAEKMTVFKKVHFGTFHSLCFTILMQVGMVSAKTLLSEPQKRQLLTVVMKNAGLEEKVSYETLSEILGHISRSKNLFLSSDIEASFTIDLTGEEFLLIRNGYENLVKEQRRMDFDDLILQCLHLFQTHPQVLQQYRKQFSYLLVDEFQDINSPQYEILKLIAGEPANLFLVGDDDQAIYGFRGASPGIMQQFIQDYPYAEQIFMTKNFRSGDCIVHLANQVISRNEERFPKAFKSIRKGGEIICSCFESRKEEEDALCRQLLDFPEEAYTETALIVRTNSEAQQYSSLLKKHGIPVREITYGDREIFQTFLWTDMKSFLSYLYAGNKRSDFICFMNKPNHFFSRLALPKETVCEKHMLQYYSQNTTVLLEVRRVFRQLSLAERLSPYLAVNLFRKTMGYDQYLCQKATHTEQKNLWLQQADKLQTKLKNFKASPDIFKIVAVEEEKEISNKEKVLYTSGVHVITMHGAKGLEFERVVLPDLNEGIIPGRRCTQKAELEEERRLLYVAITRAKDSLYLYYTKERNRKITPYLEGIIPPHPPVHQTLHCPDTRQKPPQPVHIHRRPQ